MFSVNDNEAPRVKGAVLYQEFRLLAQDEAPLRTPALVQLEEACFFLAAVCAARRTAASRLPSHLALELEALMAMCEQELDSWKDVRTWQIF